MHSYPDKRSVSAVFTDFLQFVYPCFIPYAYSSSQLFNHFPKINSDRGDAREAFSFHMSYKHIVTAVFLQPPLDSNIIFSLFASVCSNKHLRDTRGNLL